MALEPGARQTTVFRFVREALAATMDLLVPPSCLLCGREGHEPLCAGCALTLERRRTPWCARCGEPVFGTNGRCVEDHQWLAGIDAARAPWRYRGAGGGVVRALKFGRDPRASAWMGRAIVAALHDQQSLLRRAMVVPIPRHRRKAHLDGIDPAVELAEAIATHLERPLIHGLQRVRLTLAQGDPRVTSRDQNVAGAFRCIRERQLRFRPVVLVDDVCTSGATARACAAVLRSIGSGPILLATAARAAGTPQSGHATAGTPTVRG